MRRWNSIVSSWRPGDSAARVVTRRFIFPSRVVSSCLTMSLLDEGNKLPKLGGVERDCIRGDNLTPFLNNFNSRFGRSFMHRSIARDICVNRFCAGGVVVWRLSAEIFPCRCRATRCHCCYHTRVCVWMYTRDKTAN
ncbi:uncharacterized protein TERG_12321 [Trichophyton rubrum CBS 118892]|uniref:Uncharacterized protein n=1 Tax=Trichophyton rubrum (strain ATCC MYA-4607 / CBS 118892) TaxID=559305 RepID=A0A080WV84_TRIRC|nr:uncharacterized protein TERG_12321 [Trichophyton rubrum CBS 118892]KFL62028.1 hypothetical protein TERG_12321 [Trichophyton rubrum CBS 118892]